MKEIQVFEAFSGYGSQSLSLKDLNVPHKVVGISEVDINAIMSYSSLRYNIDDFKNLVEGISIEKIRQELLDLNVGYDFKKNKNKLHRLNQDYLIKLYICNKLSKNYGNIRLIDVDKLPSIDYFTYSFPCIDITVGGKQVGLIKDESSSGLIYDCEKIIESKKPKYLLMENVKALVSKKFINDFNKWCKYLESLGYTNSCLIINAKDCNIPQNRERVFLISTLEGNSIDFVNKLDLTLQIKDILEENVSSEYYIKRDFLIPKEIPCPNICASRGRNPNNTSDRRAGIPLKQRLEFNINGIANTLTTVPKDNYAYVKTENGNKIRKLTPREYFRLMGLNESEIDKLLSLGFSNTTYYSLACNSIVKQCLNEIHKILFKKYIDN